MARMHSAAPDANRPWVALYGDGMQADRTPRYVSLLQAFDNAVARAPDQPAILYFDRQISFAELDAQSRAFAAALAQGGFQKGDRMAIYLQNVPEFLVACLAAWMLGGAIVPINPMNKEREVAVILSDSRPRALVSQDTLYRDVIAGMSERPAIVFVASPLASQSRNDPRLFKDASPVVATGATDFKATIEACVGQSVPRAAIAADDPAMLVYTSGTTGVPKGAINTHGGAIFCAENIAAWVDLKDGEPVLGMAPLFHITGLVGALGIALVAKAPLVLSYRFDPGVMADSIEEHGARVAFCAVTALIALMNHPEVRREQLATLIKICSGGAPVPPAVLEQFQNKFGHYIYHGYGLTETNGPVLLVPLGQQAPVDADTSTLSVGIPLPSVGAWVADDEGRPAPAGTLGEIVIDGPALVSGYWNKPDETAAALGVDGLRTGDIGFMDKDGWFYLVDRKKDMINAGGYKVWPREVEDVIYSHPAVREAAVIGIPDSYRGETVKAVVSLKPGYSATVEEIQEYCKARMAAYKYPRLVEIIDDLPKTSSGKILRRFLRTPE